MNPKNPPPAPVAGDSTSAAEARRIAIGWRAWAVLVLCGLAGALFYMDRQVLAVLKTTLRIEKGWSDTDYGWLVTVFMACYTVCYLFTGRWIDRWGTRRAMPVFVGLMSIATILSGVARNLGEMGAFRALLGLAEAGVMPAIMVAVFSWFPPDRRGTASTVKEPLYVLGQVLATPAAVFLTQLWSWHAAFLAPGIFGLFVAGAWWWLDKIPADTASASTRAVPPVRYRDALRRRELWGVIAARLVSDPVWFFFIYWEPGFLQEKVGLSLTELGRIGWIPTAVATGTLILLGTFSDWLVVKLAWTPARSRRVILQSLACLAPTILALRFVENHALAIALLCIVRIMMVVWLNFSNLFIADLVPKNLIGTAVALMSAFGAAAGLLCNAVVGSVVSSVGYGAVFAVAACLHPLAAFILWRCYGRVGCATAVVDGTN